VTYQPKAHDSVPSVTYAKKKLERAPKRIVSSDRHLGNLTFDASDEECRCFKVTSAMLG
jgi:hypothetical protein